MLHRKYRPEFFDAVNSVLAQFSYHDRIVVEIGTRMGQWARQLFDSCDVKSLFCIDTWPRRATRGLADTFPAWYRTLGPEAFRKAHPLRGTSQEWGRVWPDDLRPVVIFVDGSHRAEAVRDDGKIWWPLLKSGGMAVFHDFDEPGVVAGFETFVDTLDRRPEVRRQRWGPGDIPSAVICKYDPTPQEGSGRIRPVR